MARGESKSFDSVYFFFTNRYGEIHGDYKVKFLSHMIDSSILSSLFMLCLVHDSHIVLHLNKTNVEDAYY